MMRNRWQTMIMQNPAKMVNERSQSIRSDTEQRYKYAHTRGIQTDHDSGQGGAVPQSAENVDDMMVTIAEYAIP